MNEIEPISILVPNQVLHFEWSIFSGDTTFQHSLKKWYNICRFHQQISFKPCVGGCGRRTVDSTFGLKILIKSVCLECLPSKKYLRVALGYYYRDGNGAIE